MPGLLHADNVRLFVSNYFSFRGAYPNRPPLSGNRFDAFRSNYRRFVSQRKCDLEDLFRKSDLRLHPFMDPLSGDLLMPFILEEDREETYSAVLEWLIHRLPAHEVMKVFGFDDSDADRSQPWETGRECHVRCADRTGRLDLVLRRNGKCRVAIEVKTKPYAEEDLRKHELYCAAMREADDMRDSEKVFLALRDENMDLGGYCFRSWRQVCQRLRRCSQSIIRGKPYGEVSLFLALLGAIEQNLLGLNRDTNAPALVSYLQEYLEGE